VDDVTISEETGEGRAAGRAGRLSTTEDLA